MIYGMASESLGIRIRRAREAKGWRQPELAAALTKQRNGRAVGVRSVGRWERGETVPRDALGALEVVLAPYFTADDAQEPDPEQDKAMLHDSIDRMDTAKLAQLRAALDAIREGRVIIREGRVISTSPRRDRAG